MKRLEPQRGTTPMGLLWHPVCRRFNVAGLHNRAVMTPEDDRLLQALLEEQARLHAGVRALDAKISAFREGVSRTRENTISQEVPAPVHEAVAPMEERAGGSGILIPPPLPSEAPSPRERPFEKQAAAVVPTREEMVMQTALPPPAAVPADPLPEQPARDNLEMQLGTVWFARIGIVVLITGLVFLGNYAWQHVVARLGAGGKLTLLVLAGALLAGLGRWLEARSEATRNFGRVLIAGGAATLYYSAYAAHFVRPLQVIASPVIGGALLLVLAALFIGWADRQRSQMVAVLTIVLAYYTSAINPIGHFTLFSSLLLTAGAVWLLLRHNWDTLGWASLAGTYGSFAYWRMVHPAAGSHWSTGLAFLLGYWILFTGSVLLRSAEKMVEARRTAFLSLNNALFFGLGAWRFLTWKPEYFGSFAMASGAVLLGMALLARRRLPEQPAVERAYLVQGLLLITVGVMVKFSGAQLAFLLAVESALLLGATRWRHSGVFQAFSLLSGAGAWLAAWLHGGNRVPAGVGAVLVFNAWWLRAQFPHLRERALDLRAGIFVAGAIALFVPATVVTLSPESLPLAWTVIALLGTASIYLLRVPELALGTQAVLAVEIVHLFATPAQALPPLVGALALSHWWQRQTALKISKELIRYLQLAWAIGAAVAGLAWLNERTTGDTWLIATSGAALAMMIYGLLTRSWAMPVAAQLFTGFAVRGFLQGIYTDSPAWYAALAPVMVVAFTAVLLLHAPRLLGEESAAEAVAIAAKVYRIGACLLFALWIWEYAPAEWRPAAYVAAGAVVLAASRFLSRDARYIGSGYLIAGLLTYITFAWGSATWRDLLSVLAAPLALRLSLRFHPAAEGTYPANLRRLIMTLAVAALWLWTTRWTLIHHGSSGLTVAWSVLALLVFGTGLALQERIYRLGGFAFLSLAVGRVFLVDVWRLETLHRILSFLVLGVVLLVLGFVYNRYADRIRRLL